MHIFAKNVLLILQTKDRSKKWLSDKSGISVQTLNGIFNQSKTPRLDTALAISTTLNSSIDSLCHGGDNITEVFTRGNASYDLTPEFLQSVKYIKMASDKLDHIAQTINTQKLDVEHSSSYVTSPTNNQKTIPDTDNEPDSDIVAEPTPEYHVHQSMVSMPYYTDDDLNELQATDLRKVGKNAAGAPREMVTDDEIIAVPIGLLPVGISVHELFCVDIVGGSMVNAGIPDGAVVLLRTTHFPVHNDIMLVRYEDKSTLKRVRQDTEGWYIQWEDGSGQVQRMKGDDWEILAEFVAVVK